MAVVHFVAPALLALLPLALVPVLVHLLFKRRRARIDFPSLWLLRHVELRLSPRRKLREYLLLAARCLFIAALVLAVARPVSEAGRAAGAGTDYVLVIDNTASMQRNGSVEAFEIARRRATEVLDLLGPKDRAALVPAVVPDGWGAGELTNDRAVLRRALETLPVSDATADMERLLERARALAEQSSAVQQEVVLFSDFRGPAARADFEGLVLVDCATPDERPNLSVQLVSVEPCAPLVGRPVDITVRVANGAKDELACSAALEIANTPLESRVVTVPGSGSTELTLRLPAVPQVGWTHGRVRLAEDGFGADNSVAFVLKVRERLRVVVVDPALDKPVPDPEAGGRFVARLLDPTGDGSAGGIEVQRVPPGVVETEGVDAVVVCGYAAVGPWRRFAEEGGLVLVFAEETDTTGPDWLAARPAGAVQRLDPPASIADRRFEDLAVRALCDLAVAKQARALLEFGGGKPALAVAPTGKGYTLCAGFGLAPAWGSFTFHPEVVAMLHRLVARYARPPLVKSAAAGARLGIPKSVRVSLDGESLGMGLDCCLRAGVYELEGKGVQPFLAVNPAAAESLLARPALDATLVEGETALAAVLSDRRVGADYAPPLLVLALLLALAEAMLANRARRSAAPVGVRSRAA